MQRLLSLYCARFGSEPTSVELLPLSGSARKYYRMAPAGVIGCIGTNLKENRAFLTIDAAMRSAGVAAPEVFGVSPDGMAYIQEDLGDGQLFSLLVPSIERGEFSAEEKGWLRDVMAALPALQYRTGAVMAVGGVPPETAATLGMLRGGTASAVGSSECETVEEEEPSSA